MRRLAAFVTPCWLLACGPDDVVIAHVAAGDAGYSDVAEERPAGAWCKSNADCAPNEFCEKVTCGSQSGGCQLRPIFCEGDRQPVCGCDGVTYWNECLRKRNGANRGANEECKIGVKCRTPNAAECLVPNAYCARIVPANQPCPPDLEGACWVLPDICPPPVPGEPTFLECGGANSCRHACDAIRTGFPHIGVHCAP